LNGNSPRNTSSRRWFVFLCIFFVLALGIYQRLEIVLETEVDNPLRADAGHYFAYAYNLRNHGVYSDDSIRSRPDHDPAPNAVANPGYPIFLTAFVPQSTNKQSINRALFKITFVQALLSSIVVLLIYVISLRFLPLTTALLVALLTAMSPHLINANIYILTEALFSFLLVTFIWLLGRKVESHHVCVMLGCGLLLGVASLVRPSLQFFIIPFFLLIWLTDRKHKGLIKATVMAMGFIAMLSPWMLRNYMTLGYLSDQSQRYINTLHYGMYPDFMYRNDPKTFGYPYRHNPDSELLSQDISAVLNEIQFRFSEQPLRHLRWYLIGKPKALWSWHTVQGVGHGFIYPVKKTPYLNNIILVSSHLAMQLLHYPLVILGLLGSVAVWIPGIYSGMTRAQRFQLWTVSMLLIYFTVLHTVTLPLPRYAIPLRPMLYLMAAFALLLLIKACGKCIRLLRQTTQPS